MEVEGNRGEPLVIEQTFDAPIWPVWNAITDKDEMRQWYFDLKEFKAEIGFQTQFDVDNNGVAYTHIWRVTEVVPLKKISYEWKYGGYPGNSLVSFELFAKGNKTGIKLTHERLDTFLPAVNPALAKENFIQGWTRFIGTNLKEFVENKQK